MFVTDGFCSSRQFSRHQSRNSPPDWGTCTAEKTKGSRQGVGPVARCCCHCVPTIYPVHFPYLFQFFCTSFLLPLPSSLSFFPLLFPLPRSEATIKPTSAGGTK